MEHFFELRGKKYPYKYCYFSEDDCHYIIATEELNTALFSDSGEYVSDEARIIDEQTFGFVNEENFYKNDKEIELILGV